MPVHLKYLAVLLFFMSSSSAMRAQEATTGELNNNLAQAHTDFIYTEDKKIYQDIYIKAEEDKKVDLNLVCYRYGSEGDSVLLFRHQSLQKIKAGAKKLIVAFQQSTDNYYILPGFSTIVCKQI
jgi:hypothetical protein